MLDSDERPSGDSLSRRVLTSDYFVGGLLTLVIVLVVLAFVLPWGEISQGAASWGWEEVDGHVLHAQPSHDGQAHLTVTYAYRYADIPYQGTGTLDVVSREHLERQLALYAPGEAVELMIHPDHPHESIIESEHFVFEGMLLIAVTSIVVVVYAFFHRSQTNHGERYSIWEANDMLDLEERRTVADRHRPGTPVEVFFDPADPEHSRIERRIPWDTIWVVPFPGVPALIALWAAWSPWRHKPDFVPHISGEDPDGTEEEQDEVEEEDEDDAYDEGDGDVGATTYWMARSDERPRKRFWETFGAGAIAALLAALLLHWATGGDGRMGLVMMYVVLFGLLATVGMGVALFDLARSVWRPEWGLRLTPGAIPLGGVCRLEWAARTRIGQLSSVRVELLGKERYAVFGGQGVMEDVTFHSQVLLDTGGSDGETKVVEFSLPLETAPTFIAEHNQIAWELRLRARVGFFPVIRETRGVLVVAPMEEHRDHAEYPPGP